MKLHEVYRGYGSKKHDGEIELVIDFLDKKNIAEFTAVAKYRATTGNYSDHPYGEGTARENHPDEIDVIELVSTGEVKQYDSDMEKVTKTWPKGTDVTKLPGWDKKADDWVDEQIMTRLED